MGTWGVDTEAYAISPYLCCWIEQAGETVVGIIGQGTSMNVTAQWETPLENTNVGSMPSVAILSAGTQTMREDTSVTTFSTTQVWKSNNPIKFNIVLEFIAISDADKQVMKALKWLQKFASPNVNGFSPFDPTASASGIGRIPKRVSINIGQKMLFTECVIESVSAPVDKEKDKSGNLIRAQVTLDCQTLTMINHDKFDSLYL